MDFCGEKVEGHCQLSKDILRVDGVERNGRNRIDFPFLIGGDGANDLLRLAEIENESHLNKIDCNLNNLINGCVDRLIDLFPKADVQIHTTSEEPIHLIADTTLLDLALMNLLENAAKYSVPPAKIEISLEKHGNHIKIIIADHGIGVSPEHLEHFFERFYRIDENRSRTSGGSGLGLSIVQKIIQKHGGEISVHSQLNVGTTFTILL